MAAKEGIPSDYPARNAAVVTPDNSNDLAHVTRALFIGGAGNLNVDTADGDTVLFTGVTAGMILPLAVKRVRSTSTTATNIVALW